MNELDVFASLVIGPLSSDEFFRDHWEQSPLHISRNCQTHFSAVLQLQQIESLLSTQALYYPQVQLSRRDNPVASASYTDAQNHIVPLRLIENFHDGATIILSQAHQNIASLATLRRQVQETLKLRCQTNLYYSPPGKQGFNAHYDSHDVFILQVQGVKTFNFYGGGLELPYNHEGFDASVHVPGELTESITVEPGDTLYIPRGVMHDAVANDSASLHITLGVYAMTLRDTLLAMVEVATERDERYRQSLPHSLWSRPDSWTGSTLPVEHLQALLDPALSSEHVLQAMSNLADEIAVDGLQNCEGALASVRRESVLQPESVVQIKPGCALNAQRDGDTVRYRVAGLVMEFTDPLGQALEQLLNRQTMTLADMSGVDNEQRQALCLRSAAGQYSRDYLLNSGCHRGVIDLCRDMS